MFQTKVVEKIKTLILSQCIKWVWNSHKHNHIWCL